MDGLPVIGGELMLKVVMICIFAVVVLYLYLIAPRIESLIFNRRISGEYG